jgi:hypothetical protein
MQIKTVLRFHLTPVQMAINKVIYNNKYWWGWNETGTLIHCWWEFKLVICLLPAWVCCVNLTKNGREWEIRHTQTYRHKAEKLGMGGLYVPDEICEHLPEPECLFYRSVQRKGLGKNQASIILWSKVKGKGSGELIFLRLEKLNYYTFVLGSSRHARHLI